MTRAAYVLPPYYRLLVRDLTIVCFRSGPIPTYLLMGKFLFRIILNNVIDEPSARANYVIGSAFVSNVDLSDLIS